MAASEHRSRSRSKLTRKELKAPDEFLTLTGRALDFASQHVRGIAIVLGLVLAGLAVAGVTLAYLHGLEQEAFVTLSHVEAQLRSVGDAQEVPPGLIDQLERMTQRWGIGEAQGYAWLYLGHAHYRQGDYPAAVAAYRRAQATVQSSRLLWPLAALGAGYALEASGEWQGAQEAYQHVIDTQPPEFVVEAYLGKGRVAERNHDVNGAIAAYSTVVERYPAYAQTLGIADKIEALKARHD